jgi:transcriptional regulator with XRE-family HTH domain
MNILKTIAKNLRQRRSELGLTQEDVAIKLNIARQNYRLYETGINEIKVTKLEKIAKVLDKPISYFLSDRRK